MRARFYLATSGRSLRNKKVKVGIKAKVRVRTNQKVIQAILLKVKMARGMPAIAA